MLLEIERAGSCVTLQKSQAVDAGYADSEKTGSFCLARPKNACITAFHHLYIAL
tara:strand:- start:12642 stop:12803 length:162 start_codon:yes stop_codon:yes gene_type:complete